MLFRAALVLVLSLLALFAWRAWRPMPALALGATVLAGAAGLLLLRYPAALGASALLTWGLFALVSRGKR